MASSSLMTNPTASSSPQPATIFTPNPQTFPVVSPTVTPWRTSAFNKPRSRRSSASSISRDLSPTDSIYSSAASSLVNDNYRSPGSPLTRHSFEDKNSSNVFTETHTRQDFSRSSDGGHGIATDVEESQKQFFADKLSDSMTRADEERREVRREQNRRAARKYRHKQQRRANDTLQEFYTEDARHRSLSSEIEWLLHEKSRLQHILSGHERDCNLLSTYRAKSETPKHNSTFSELYTSSLAMQSYDAGDPVRPGTSDDVYNLYNPLQTDNANTSQNTWPYDQTNEPYNMRINTNKHHWHTERSQFATPKGRPSYKSHTVTGSNFAFPNQ